MVPKKQSVVAFSTTKAEFVTTDSYACQGVWMRRVLEKLGHSQGKCTTVLCDNSSTIKLSKNPVMHGRSKHIDVMFHFLHDLTRDGVVELKHCVTQAQVIAATNSASIVDKAITGCFLEDQDTAPSLSRNT